MLLKHFIIQKQWIDNDRSHQAQVILVKSNLNEEGEIVNDDISSITIP